MTLVEVLRVARDSYVSALSEVLHDHGPCHIEPAVRNARGELVMDGHPPSPIRLDFVVKASGERVRVDAAPDVSLRPCEAAIGSLRLAIKPFGWDQATLRVEGAGSSAAQETIAWFMRWFDPEDVRPAEADGFYGVVHFISDIVDDGRALEFTVDFGSVSTAAVEELFGLLAKSGATRGSVS